MAVINGVCSFCGSAVLDFQHLRDDLEPCFGKTPPIDDPLNAEFWWHNHERLVREGRLPKPFSRNPEDIKTALGAEPDARGPILAAHTASRRMLNINQYQSAVEAGIYTAIARLMDAGILVRPTKGSAE